VRDSFVERGLLEIHRFLSPALLDKFDPETVSMEEFLRYLAQARYVQELEVNVFARAISEAFTE
jgi:hypothetical protein